jgi:hypothetical protein
MKIILAILAVFLITLATSLLYDWNFINQNYVRLALVTILISIEIIAGFFYVKVEIKNSNLKK